MEIAQATKPTAIMGFAIQVTMNTENILKERGELLNSETKIYYSKRYSFSEPLKWNILKMGHYCDDKINHYYESTYDLEECGTFCHRLGASILNYNPACSWPPCRCSCCSHSTSFTASNDSEVGNVYEISGTANIFRSFWIPK